MAKRMLTLFVLYYTYYITLLYHITSGPHIIDIITSHPPSQTVAMSQQSERYTIRQRSLIFAAVAIGKSDHNLPVDQPTLDETTYRQALHILQRPDFCLHRDSPPTYNTVKRIIGESLSDEKPKLSKPGRPLHPDRHAVEVLVDSGEASSSRHISNALGKSISPVTVQRAVKNLNYHRYRIPTGQHMPPDNFEKRFEFGLCPRRKIASCELNIFNTVFTDECLVGLNVLNRHNAGTYHRKGEFTDCTPELQQRQAHSSKVHILLEAQILQSQLASE